MYPCPNHERDGGEVYPVMRIAVVGDYKFTTAPHWMGILEGIQELGHEAIPLHYEGNVAVPEHDLIIVGTFLEQDFGDKAVYWFCDIITEKPTFPNKPVFLSYRGLAQKYGAHHLFQGARRQKEVLRDSPNADVVFVGNPNPNTHFNHLYDRRKELLKLTEPKVYSGNTPEERAEIFGQLPSIFGNAAICLGIDAGYDIDCGFANRIWNTLGAGGFLLMQYTLGMERYFTNKKHLVWFKEPKEAPELVNYYLNHQDEARKIAKAGFRLVQSKHTYKNRIEDMLRTLSVRQQKS